MVTESHLLGKTLKGIKFEKKLQYQLLYHHHNDTCVINPFYPEASADELQPVPDHFLKSICQHLKMTGLHLKWT